MDNLKINDDIDLVTYMDYRKMVNWPSMPEDEAKCSLDHSAIKISIVKDNETIGICRVVWDYGYTAYLADVIVDEKYRGQGIGKLLVNTALDRLKSKMKPGWKMKVVLVAAAGKEDFYKKFGFVSRPNDHEGAGMNMTIEAF